jgi:hypothetical protein
VVSIVPNGTIEASWCRDTTIVRGPKTTQFITACFFDHHDIETTVSGKPNAITKAEKLDGFH